MSFLDTNGKVLFGAFNKEKVLVVSRCLVFSKLCIQNIVKHRLQVCSWSWILASHSHHWEHRPVSLLMAAMPPHCSPLHPPLSRQCFHQNGSENTSEHINNEIYGRRGQSDRSPWLIATQNHFNFWLESFHLHKYFINIFYCPDPNALNHRTDKKCLCIYFVDHRGSQFWHLATSDHGILAATWQTDSDLTGCCSSENA